MGLMELFRLLTSSRERRRKWREQFDETFSEAARHTEYDLLIETSAGEMAAHLTKRAQEGGWSLKSFKVVPSQKAGEGSPATAAKESLTFISLVTRRMPKR